MKMATNNRLAHIQCEMVEVNEQYVMISNQLALVNTELVQIEQYLRMNNGDAFYRKKYRDTLRQRNSLGTQGGKLQRRYNSLCRQLMVEQRKIAFGR